MKTFKEYTLKRHISEKGITMTRKGNKLFRQYDYYQVINGYKYLFVDATENIDDIKRKILSTVNSHEVFYSEFFNVKRYTDKNDSYRKVCEKICQKYGIDLDKNSTISSMENEIKTIGYRRHIFCPNSNYEDFVRMYLFEHELRNLLLKYILFIEERIKKVFIAVLNDMNVDSNCLADISNYNLSRKNKGKALGSLGKIIEMHNNKNSKPILHKMEQELTVPFWIIINEMTLKQTLITANCLSEDWSRKIFQSLANELTTCNFDIFDTNKSRRQINHERECISQFTDILFHLADFRNHLAHNQPVYCYNVGKHFPINREMPHLNTKSPTFARNKKAGMSYLAQQRQMNLPLLNATRVFFGNDTYNSRNNATPPFDINLSWIVYCINRIIRVIIPNNKMKIDLCNLYKKYNVILSFSSTDYNGECCAELFDFLSNGHIDGKNTKFNSTKLSKLLNKIQNNQKRSDYISFSRCSSYYEYTNIDFVFLINILY